MPPSTPWLPSTLHDLDERLARSPNAIMNKLANMRHWSERMSPNFGIARPPMPPMPPMNPHPKNAAQHGPPISMPHANDSVVHYAFNVPLASDVAGPDTEDIVYATYDAVIRWTHPNDAPDEVQVHELPVHAQNLLNLQRLCRGLSEGPLPIEAHVLCTIPEPVAGSTRERQTVTVCLSGPPELVNKSRETILNGIPISMVRHDAVIRRPRSN